MRPTQPAHHDWADESASTVESASEPWLSHDQQRVWRSFLSLTRMLDERIERDMQQHGGMPFAYYLILAMLSEAPDRRLRMNRLSEMVKFSQSRLSHAVNRLEELDWVRRYAAEGDRRGQVAELTQAGRDRLDQVSPLHAETVRSTLFDSLTDEQLATFEELIEQVLTANSAARYAMPPEQ